MGTGVMDDLEHNWTEVSVVYFEVGSEAEELFKNR